MMNQEVLSLQSFNIQRGNFILCQDINFVLRQGEICHLVGENGLGKSTLFYQLVGLLPVLAGEVKYFEEVRLPINPLYVSHQLGLHEALSVGQNLQFLLSLHGVNADKAQLNEALTWVGLSGFIDTIVSHLSAGQMRRVGLARLYILNERQTPLWLLDEPFTALDVSMVSRVENRLKEFAHHGGAVLLTSHQSVSVANHQLNLMEYVAKEPTWNDEEDVSEDCQIIGDGL